MEKKSGLTKNVRAKKRRDEAWRRMKRKPVQERKVVYKLERNEYVKVRREEEEI